MFVKKTRKRTKSGTYFNYLLVESVATVKGPRHRVVCSLGSLAPAPREEWLALAHRIESTLGGQLELSPDQRVAAIVETVRAQGSLLAQPTRVGRSALAPVRLPASSSGARQPSASSDGRAPPTGQALEAAADMGGGGSLPPTGDGPELVSVLVEKVSTEKPREAGPVHVGHQMWKRLKLEAVLAGCGMSSRARMLTEVMTLNRLVKPLTEHAMPDWVRRTALADILKADFSTLCDESLYENLDVLHPWREKIERTLAENERTLFNLDPTLFLYDLTSTYFEGACLANPQAKRGYSRDSRPDCKQVVVGLVLDKDGFPKAHEVFDGNRTDRTTLDEMLDALEKRTGKKGGCTVVVDRGMAFADNLEQIKKRHHHYLVASRQGERDEHLEQFEGEDGWQQVVRQPSPSNPGQKKTRVLIKKRVAGDELHLLCWSDGRVEKDRAIREKHEKRLLEDLEKLRERVATGRLSKEGKINEAIGRLKERYSRVARYYEVTFESESRRLMWRENVERKRKAETLDGTYLLKTDNKDMKDEEIWRTYILLTRVESAFRSMKSPLMERPIFHHLKHRVQTHIFLCVLAYHLLVAIEKSFRDRNVHTSWETLRQQLSTHQVNTVVLPTSSGEVLKIRKGSTPEPAHREIYSTLRISEEVMSPVLTWGAG